ncbi:MAG: ABC transporter permease [Dehalococcoidales bacterium]|nr:ABC transporter permease [Dehalococcoidales bacterium]
MPENPVVPTPNDIISIEPAPPRRSEWRRFARVFFGRKLYLVGFIIVVIIILTAIFAPVLTPYDPEKNDLTSRLQTPNAEHLLGTDQLGRDILTRIVYGARVSLIIGFSAVFASTIVGTIMGLAAAHYGGWVFAIIMRIADVLMALPAIILMMLIAGMLKGGGIWIVVFALGFGGIAPMARMMCGQALSVKQNDYIMAARAVGMSNWRIMFTQIFPNAYPPLIVGLTMGIGGVVLGEAGLSFLGIGVQAPTPSWGGMVMDGQRFLLTNPLLSLMPGVAIMFLVFGFNMVGDGVRDAIDPRLRGVI